MIYIDGRPADTRTLSRGYPARGVEYICINRLANSERAYKYSSEGELAFELALRRAIVSRADSLRRSGLNFETFRGAFCNERYWRRGADGGFELRNTARASAAVRDIYENGRNYGTECATAMQIVYYGALLDTVPAAAFDKRFVGIRLMNWHDISEPLRETGALRRERDMLPGDRRYFANPDVNLETPEWQGENVIDMGDGTYYGHGIGRRRAEEMIMTLNRARRRGAKREAYLTAAAGRP
ncbi:MAG: protein-glutamine gamma-glutamyltransferase, partial [Oscillospiraceae bacterium]|nr:protein-glutamine gamma-glutamyltransferase [Oscillospiraceae bacterium]